MAVSDIALVLPGIALGCAAVVLGLSVWLFTHKRARTDQVRNAVLLLSFLCLTASRVLDLLEGIREDSLDPETRFTYYGVSVEYAYQKRIIYMIAFTAVDCVFTLGLLFVYTRLMLSLLYRPDLASQTKVYRRFRTIVYSVYAVIVALALSAMAAWIYLLACTLNDTLHVAPNQAPSTLDVSRTVVFLSLFYTLSLSVLTCLITHESRFSTGTMTLYQMSLTAASASFLFEAILQILIPQASYTPGPKILYFVLSYAENAATYERIRSMVTALATLLLPWVMIRGFAKRPARGRLSQWRRAAFGDAGPPYARSDIESRGSSATSSGGGAGAEKQRTAAVEVDSSPISEAGGRVRAELPGEDLAELPGDVEIAEMEAGKEPGESAYVKATKGYDAEVLESAEDRAKAEAG